MRFVLFYSGVLSFNYFTDQISKELKNRSHDVFILDIRNSSENGAHSYQKLEQFLKEPLDAVICFDGFGLKNDLFIQLWDEKDTLAVNILMDHPLRFHPTMNRHPKKYIQFCCDRNHVEYVRKYFAAEVAHVAFMPHAGTRAPQKDEIPFSKRKYDILFSGSYVRPEIKLSELDQTFPDGTAMNFFYKAMADYLIRNSAVTVEQAALDVIAQMGMQVSKQQLKGIFRCAEPIDWLIRMYQRGRVVQAIAEAGFDIWLLGNGWEDHPSIGRSNVHRLDDFIPYGQTLAYMGDAKINLNVMPWFKSGTHDRIFNILLRHSLPLTDSSSWLKENYIEGEELAVFDLDRLEQLPGIVQGLLEDEGKSEDMIRKGYEKTNRGFTWVNCTDQILAAVQDINNG